MNCPACNAQNPDEAFFCGSCGGQLRSAMSRPGGPLSLDPPQSEHASPNRIDLAAIGQAALDAEAAQSPAPPDDPLAPRPATSDNVAPNWASATDYPVTPAASAPPQSYVAPPPGSLPSTPYQPPQNPYQPSAGLYQPPPAQYQPGQYPPGQLPPPPPVPGGMYPYAPPDGNTSGMGPGYPLPREAEGWSFAGFVPWGLFSFINGNSTWGVIGLVTYFFGLYLIYSIYVGIKGREMAWQSRRFDSIQQFEETMKAWNMWGMIVLGLIGAFILIYIIFIVVMIMAAATGAGGFQ